MNYRTLVMACLVSPVITGDSLVMDGSSRHPGRSAITTSSIRRVELHGVDAPRTIVLLAILGGVVLGVRAPTGHRPWR